ncbi:hypothetical protein TSTA_089870 [Talaromyces stipitatus ATCC 10500]|uniref:Uncharacterized protein n=1 Tax=Talaromyces stipitatus (strain ATCC 10500 / CBS 375.48 / QM 6759 / NRRL 1006) TaxID=441959 RepID=B8M0W8_TALSN|nr:uncharacterized protein TSTA_089870 [Talaromyces stipitatus ATCC 10500]EED21748.1 hypothetical protein TSTA_089870 [Talaromyces stipitatus ATCC 10500]
MASPEWPPGATGDPEIMGSGSGVDSSTPTQEPLRLPQTTPAPIIGLGDSQEQSNEPTLDNCDTIHAIQQAGESQQAPGITIEKRKASRLTRSGLSAAPKKKITLAAMRAVSAPAEDSLVMSLIEDLRSQMQEVVDQLSVELTTAKNVINTQ